jgi:hypothetical protein
MQRRCSRTDLKWGRMANKSEEGQGSQRAVLPLMMMSYLSIMYLLYILLCIYIYLLYIFIIYYYLLSIYLSMGLEWNQVH